MHQLDAPRRKPLNQQQWLNPSCSNNPLRSQPNGHSDPNLQLPVSTNKPDNISELLEGTKNDEVPQKII